MTGASRRGARRRQASHEESPLKEPVITRRRFIHHIARVAGAGAALAALDALGATALALGEDRPYNGPPVLPAGLGKGRRVTIIGAGIAGLTSALELSKAGFTCTVLEARSRPGGRNWTIRGGDRVVQTDGTQTVAWPQAPHLYFNAGPARIPHHHRALLGYCRELGVQMEIMMNDNRAALLQDDKAFGGKPVQAKQVVNDTRGYLSELLSKAMSSGGLDRELSRDDRERLSAVVAAFGDLREDGRFKGTGRAGFIEPPGAAMQFGTPRAPLPLAELLKADFWQFKANFGEDFEMASTMLQPVGGMDQIPRAFAARVGHLIRYDSVVDAIRKTATGARVQVRLNGGPVQAIDSDFVICTVPLSVLRAIPNDFAPAVQQAIASVAYATSSKIAFYAPRRFWEEDDAIYGGNSWTTREITQILYPSHGITKADGVLVGSYCFGFDPADDMGRFPVAERLRMALASGERLHPGYAGMVRNGVSVAWPKVPFNSGSWALWTDEQRKGSVYRALLQADGPVYFAGEHLSNLVSWQEGAILSAHRTIAQLAARVGA